MVDQITNAYVHVVNLYLYVIDIYYINASILTKYKNM